MATDEDKDEDDFDKDRYCTPPKAIAPVHRFWPQGIGLDPCADPDQIVHAFESYDIRCDEDGLALDWRLTCDTSPRTVFYNPPYSNAGPWVFQAATMTALDSNMETVGLLAPKTDAQWWSDGVWASAAAVCFVRGRFKFLREGKVTGTGRGLSTYVLHAGADVRAAAIRRFVASFSSVGQVVTNRDGWGT